MMMVGNAANAEDDSEPEARSINEKMYMLNFLQKSKMRTRTYKSNANEDSLSELRKTLLERGLAVPAEIEHKQRALV